MLQSILKIILITTAFSSFGALSEESVLPKALDDALNNNPYLNEVSKQRLTDMATQSRSSANKFKRRFSKDQLTPMMKAWGFADENMANEREKLLNSLGLSYLDPNIYIFISFSMPVELIQAYAREAMWSGAILVLRGMGEEDTIKSFYQEKMFQIVGKKGASATIQIDPRLFDAFQINSVPTIVFTEVDSLDLCKNVTKTSGLLDSEAYPYHECESVEDSQYWKLSGTVTLDWALKQFYEAGVDGALKQLNVLRENLRTGGTKKQTAFTGDWDSVPTPELKQLLSDGLQNYGQFYESPKGIFVGPPDLVDPTNRMKKVEGP